MENVWCVSFEYEVRNGDSDDADAIVIDEMFDVLRVLLSPRKIDREVISL